MNRRDVLKYSIFGLTIPLPSFFHKKEDKPFSDIENISGYDASVEQMLINDGRSTKWVSFPYGGLEVSKHKYPPNYGAGQGAM